MMRNCFFYYHFYSEFCNKKGGQNGRINQYSKEGMGKDTIPERKPYTTRDCRQGRRFARDSKQMDQRWQMGGAQGRNNPYPRGTGAQLIQAGRRYPTSKEADILGKLSAAIKNMETDVGIADVISVLTRLIEFVKAYDLDKAKQLTATADSFIKSLL